MKANPWDLIQAHYKTFRDNNSGDPRPQDYLLFLGAPALCAVVAVAFGLDLPVGASIALVTTSGLLSAFFFGVTLQVLERAMDWAERMPVPGSETSWRADLLEEIAANAGYASLVSIVTAAAFVGALIAHGHGAAVVFSALATALAVHLVLLLSMVLARVFALTTERLDDARVGGASGNVTTLTNRRAS